MKNLFMTLLCLVVILTFGYKLKDFLDNLWEKLTQYIVYNYSHLLDNTNKNISKDFTKVFKMFLSAFPRIVKSISGLLYGSLCIYTFATIVYIVFYSIIDIWSHITYFFVRRYYGKSVLVSLNQYIHVLFLHLISLNKIVDGVIKFSSFYGIFMGVSLLFLTSLIVNTFIGDYKEWKTNYRGSK